jgi:polyphosphate glucokinase
MDTLCIDIGGTGLKAMIFEENGAPRGERVRVLTPRPATPDAVLGAILHGRRLARRLRSHRRRLPRRRHRRRHAHRPQPRPAWNDFPLAAELEKRTGKPARVANDAGVQGLAVIEGKGTELVITLGTGMGFALYIDGRYVPNIEMAHHPFEKGKTYEQRVGDAERKAIGNKRWRARVARVIAQLQPIFNYRRLYLGGGNAQRLEPETLPADVTVVENVAGLLGGLKLWQ